MSDFAQGALVFAAGAMFGVGIYIMTPITNQRIREIQGEK